jgi:hypothetical protein
LFKRAVQACAFALGLSFAVGCTPVSTEEDPADHQAIAKEAWLYAYAPLQGYQTLYTQALNPASNGYVGGFNRFRHYSRLSTPSDSDIVTPNNDTPYSWAWLDLRAEPIVLVAETVRRIGALFR